MTEREIFLAALEKDDPTERAAYLDQACGADTALRQRAEALLRAHETSPHFMDVPVVEQMADKGGGLDFLDPPQKPNSLGRLGHYEVLEVVGRGGMGVVFRAFDTKLHRVVAIKALAPQLATSSAAQQRFVREARAAAAVTHDNVIAIHAVEDAGLVPYLVMQFIDGSTLQKKLDRTGQLPPREILGIALQIAEGLAAAHRHGVVHRDVKPANILLEHGIERVKITDFGLARAGDDASLTQSGVVAGTPMYMSPEQADGLAVDFRSDLFSLGSVLYTMCTGRPPFRAPTPIAVLKRVCEERPRPIREVNPELPPWLEELVVRLHAKAPADRLASAREVADLLARRLAELQRGGTPSAPVPAPSAKLPREKPTPTPPARRRRLRVMAAAVLLALLAGLGLSEATGVTNVRGTVIRLFSPEGTLVVEVDDPGVSVGIEGSDVVITGAGVKEIRLKPGGYTVEARKDGKLVSRELITVAQNGRQVVRVSLEGARTDPKSSKPAAEATAWERSVAALPAADQFEAVRKELKKRNPKFDGRIGHDTVDGRIQNITLEGPGLLDISPVRALAGLQHIAFNCPEVADLSPLRGMGLTGLALYYSGVSDLSPLRGMKLRTMDLSGSRKIADLSPLRRLPLEGLTIYGTQVTDLKPLEGMPLGSLNCGSSEVSDLSPLKGLPLRALNLVGSKVSDLSPLKGTSLTELHFGGTAVTDLSPIKDLPLKTLSCDFKPERDAKILRAIKTLAWINGKPAAQFWKEVGE
jgi:hypothetical protein